MQYGSTGLGASPNRFMTFSVNITSAGRLRSLKCSRDMALKFVRSLDASQPLIVFGVRLVTYYYGLAMCIPPLPAATPHRFRLAGR